MGYGLGLGYTYSLDENWDINAGVEMLFVGAQAAAQHLSGDFKATVTEKPTYMPVDLMLNSNYTDYKEHQYATYLNIPVMWQWHTNGLIEYMDFMEYMDFIEYMDFYAQVGVKTGLALGGSYNITANELITSGDIPAWSVTLLDNPNHNFGTQTDINQIGSLSFELNFAIVTEVGVKWTLADRWLLYTGLYVDYGLLNIAPKKSVALVNMPLDSKSNLTYNSILNATTNGAHYADRVNLLTIGIKIKIAYSIE
jgi:hypothetical protein